jgi:hypothetical protein
MKKSPLGVNPLAQGIFQPTQKESKNQETRNLNQETRYLEKGEREAVNFRLPIELNDWLNERLRVGKRKHGSKIPKEIWVQAALELFCAMPIDWAEIESEEHLKETLKKLESRIKTLES